MQFASGTNTRTPVNPWRQARAELQAGRLQQALTIYQSIVSRDPSQAAAWCGLSDIVLRQGRFRAAVEHVRKAASALRDRPQWQLLPTVAMRLLSLGEYSVAAETILAAPHDDPAIISNGAGLARLLGLAEFHAQALELLENTSGHKPPDAQTAYSFATAFRHLGRLTEATSQYERCIAMAPGHLEAHWALAYHQPSKPAGARLDRLRSLERKVPPDSPAFAFIAYALFKELDGAGEHDDAWRTLQAGMHSKRRLLQFDSAAEQKRYQQLIKLCNRDFLAHAAAPPAMHVPIFIVGLPRTGTTLLERILGNHSRVRSAGELGDFHMQLCWEADVPASDILDPRLLDAASHLDFDHLGTSYLQRTAWRTQGNDFLIDKFPANIAYAGLIRKALPQARIVCLRRDPMDSVFSNLKELFSGNAYPHSYDLHEMADHCIRFRQLVDHWTTVMPEAFHVVDYEQLVARPEEVTRKVMDFCGLEFETTTIDIQRNDSPSATASSSQVREGIHGRSVGAWRIYADHLDAVSERLVALAGSAQ